MNTSPPALAVVVTAMVGGAVALQAPINSHLGRSVGTFQAAFLSFVIGTVSLLAIAALASGGLGGLRHVSGVPWYDGGWSAERRLHL